MAVRRDYAPASHPKVCPLIDFPLAPQSGRGEGGIRTLGTLLGYGALAKRCFRPLSHLTKLRAGAAFRAGLALGRTICFGIADCQQSVAPDAMESCRGSC